MQKLSPKPTAIFIVLLAFLMAWSGCGEPGAIVPETEDPDFARGRHRLSQERYEEALGAFLNVIDKRKTAPESHLEAAEIYLTHLNEPVTAIYHYRRFLEFIPESNEAAMVRQRIETAQKDFARQLPSQPFQESLDRLEILDMMDALRDENTNLKRQLLAAKERVSNLEGRLGISSPNPGGGNPSASLAGPIPQASEGNPESPGDSQAAATNERTYTVVGGDTLTRISQRVYGSPGRWMDIYQANRDTMDSPNSLRVGQVLRLP